MAEEKENPVVSLSGLINSFVCVLIILLLGILGTLILPAVFQDMIVCGVKFEHTGYRVEKRSGTSKKQFENNVVDLLEPIVEQYNETKISLDHNIEQGTSIILNRPSEEDHILGIVLLNQSGLNESNQEQIYGDLRERIENRFSREFGKRFRKVNE